MRRFALASAIAALSSTTALAQPAETSEPPREAPGEVIVVTGLRLPREVRDVPTAITVIDRAQLERAPQLLADEILRGLPSVGTFRRSSSLVADPTSQGLNLRGVGPSGVSRALVLRDGVPANDPFGGWVYWRAMSPLGIDRIEVAPSGASALFGDFALGGVAHVISRPITGRSIDALLSGGSLRTGRAALRATERFGELGIAVDGEAMHSDGYTPITAADRGAVDHAAASDHGAAGIRVEHTRGGSTTHATARWFDESLDAGTVLTTADVTTISYGGGWRLDRGDADTGSQLAVELFGGHQLFRQTRARVAPDRSTAALSSSQRTPSNNQGGSVTYTFRPWTRHAIVVGADARRVTGTSTDALSPPMIEPDTLVERSAGGEQRLAGAFVEDTLRLGRVDLLAALRLDGWQNLAGQRTLVRDSGETMTIDLDRSSELQLDPRVGALVHVTDVVGVRGSVYRAFRAPTLNELYRPFQVGTVLTAANENLRPETLWGAEAGPQILVSNVVVRATGFYNRLEDAIANVTLPMPVDGAQRQRQNLGAARIAGLELEASWRPSERWTVAASETFIQSEVTDAPAQPDLVGKRLAQNPRLRATGELVFDDPRLVAAAAQVRYLGNQFEDDQNTLPIGAVVLVDARLARRLGAGLTGFATVQNLFDRRYLVGRAGVDTEGAPRTFELGVAYSH
ncbi:MAG TPA: TonB-dependent receptor [Kofleriaceae bacterium]|nr:TonB-dependent receptor [Kofleriaceae bacterium]